MARFSFKLLGFMILAASLGGGWMLMDLRSFTQTPLRLDEQGLLYEVKPGASLRGIADELAQAGVLEHPFYLVWLARWRGDAGRIKAGEYFFPAGTTPAQWLEQVVAGRVLQHSLTIVEGWTFKQMMEAVEHHPALSHTLTGLEPLEVMAELGHAGEHPEGRFLPDTYQFPRGTTDVSFLRRAHDAMDRHLATEWSQRAAGLPYQAVYEALIMASIVEKETGLASERGQIAGVFARRLRKGMRLQTDPTVIYALGESYDGNIRRRDLQVDSPYNTYLYAGLPPTPIALPGADAIHAALHPAAGESLYFVARGDGSHVFSATLAEHNEAVRRYQITPHPAENKGDPPS